MRHSSSTHRYPAYLLCLLLLMCLLPARPAEAAQVRYRVVTSTRDHAITKGSYSTFEAAYAAAKTSAEWYVVDTSGNIVYPSPVVRSQQIDRACKYLEAIAADNRHGFGLHSTFRSGSSYSSCRYRLFMPFSNAAQVRKSLTGLGEYGNFNCSTAQIMAYTLSGYADLIANGASGVGNFQTAAVKCGFTNVTASVNLRTGKGLKRGDILIFIGNERRKGITSTHNHMSTYLGNGKLLWCTGNLDGGRNGDTNGREIYVRAYVDHGWQTVLRPSLTKDGTTRKKITTIDGINWAPVYNYDYYIAHNPDVKKAYSGDYMLTLRHFVKYGMREGRQGSANFNVAAYKHYNPDLVAHYGNNSELNYKLFYHYVRYAYGHENRRTKW